MIATVRTNDPALASADRRITVGVDVREWVARRQTGIARYLSSLLETWSAEGSRLSPVLYGNQSTVVPEAFGVLPARRIPERVTLWWDQISLARALSADGADVFLSPYGKAPVMAPCPVVITVHDLIYLTDDGPGEHARPLYRTAYLAAARLIARRAARVITDSERSRADVVRLLRVPAEKIRVIPIGLPPGHAPAAPARVERVRVDYDLPGPYVLYVGNFKPHKNLPRLLAAFAALPADVRSRHHLVLAGSADSFTPALRRTAEALGIEGRVRFTGFVADQDLAALYTGAAVLVLASLAEGFGVPIIEAMGYGTAVICSNVAPLTEVAGDAALTVDPQSEGSIAAGLGRLLTDDTLRAKVAAAGRRRAADFAATRSAGAVEGVLREAVETGRS